MSTIVDNLLKTPKSESTWEPRTKFMEDQPVMVRKYENQL